MRYRNAVLIFSCVAAVSGCSFMGQTSVRVETGNQQSGYLSRPLQFTISSDESVEQVAQRICNNVKPNSIAEITFVGKEAGPDPFDIGDWGRYRYDCKSPVKATAAVPAGTANPVTPGAPGLDTEGDEPHRRECQRQQGRYQICLGSCTLSSTNSSAVVAAECQERCAPQMPAGCN